MKGVDLRDRQAYLAEQIAEQMGRVNKRAKPWRSILALTLALVAAGVAYSAHANRHGSQQFMWTVVWIVGAVVFTLSAASGTLGLSGKVRQMLQTSIGNSHATMVRVVMVLVGWAIILTVTLDIFGIPIERLLLGGALTGVLLGIAAQQTLANLFAGIVLLLTKPFQVGDEVKLFSGPLGGSFEGQIIEIGLAYVRLDTDAGVMHLPNAQVLSAAAGPRPKAEAEGLEGPDGAAPLPDGLPNAGGTATGAATAVEIEAGEQRNIG